MNRINTADYPESHVPAVPSNREIPHDYQAEQCVLGCLMCDPEAFDQASAMLTRDDFYEVNHQIIFESCQRLAAAGQNIDPVTLRADLESRNLFSRAGGQNYIAGIMSAVPGGASVASYASVVKDRSVKRLLLRACRDVAEFIFTEGGATSAEVLHKAEGVLLQISERTLSGDSVGPRPISEVADETLQRISTNINSSRQGGSGVTGVSTGFTELDKLTGGFHEGELIILAARPGMGKTTLAMNIAENVFLGPRVDKPVLVFSLEMPAWQLVMRMLSALSDVKLESLNSGKVTAEDMRNLGQAVALLRNQDRGSMLYIDDQTGISPSDVRVRARKILKEHGGLSLIVIDYLQHMSIPGYGTDKLQEVSEISRSLKQIAMDLKVPVVALAQLSRSPEKRPDKRPMNSDLRDSGAIEQDADLIMFIYRDDYYHKDSKDRGLSEIIISKQRNGPTGDFKLVFENEYSRFANYNQNYDSPDMQPRPSDVNRYGS